MSEPKSPGDENLSATGATAAPATPEAADPAGEPQIGLAQMKEIVEALQIELDGQKNQTLRLVADMDNLRKRLEREKEETAKFAIAKFAGDLVGVADNFERAIAAVPQGAAEQDPALQSLVEGVSMTERELLNVLEKHGVKRDHPLGEMSSPHRHQTVMGVDNPDVAPGTIVQVFQPGYMIGDRVIRAAMVAVAQGGAKSAKTDSTEPAPAASSETDLSD